MNSILFVGWVGFQTSVDGWLCSYVASFQGNWTLEGWSVSYADF